MRQEIPELTPGSEAFPHIWNLVEYTGVIVTLGFTDDFGIPVRRHGVKAAFNPGWTEDEKSKFLAEITRQFKETVRRGMEVGDEM